MTEEQNIPSENPELQNPASSPVINYKKSKTGSYYFGQLGILIALIGGGLIVGSFLSLLSWMMMTGSMPKNPEKDMLNPAFANAAKIMQLVLSFAMFFLPAFFYALIKNRNPFRYLGFRSLVSSKQLLLIAGLVLAGIFLSGSLSEINQLIPIPKNLERTFHKWEDNYSDEIMAMATMKTFWDFLFSLVVIALAPAIFEEVLFRGGFQQLFIKWFGNPWVGIIVTSVIFSAVHVSYYGFLSRAALGIILGLLFFYSRNIWLNILLHFLNNAFGLTQLYFISKDGKIPKEAMDDNIPFVSGSVSLFAVLLLFAVTLTVIITFIQLFKKECTRIGADQLDNTFSPSDNPFE